VVYVGWLKGYGQVMIVDHRGGYYTLFAYLSRALKERGDMVKQGAEIALVGDTGPDSTPGLYFEIRQKGVPRDPMSWLAAR
ncbi:MAG: peptidoglycan DD-metalloendopeptidase family protein, partial [Deltaproteobacteria bacterium]|nr:peptidoglycan DD-metalloendopeptidase family protein [Deltaproteobacteria bacterium]